MRNTFDWLRCCRTGAELMATVRFFAKKPSFTFTDLEFGAPLSALDGPCQRCYFFARHDAHSHYCRLCKTILAGASRFGILARKCLVVWSVVNELPPAFRDGSAWQKENIRGYYVHDQKHFLVMMHRRQIKTWLQDIALYYGAALKGVFQIFPTVGVGKELGMGEILCWAGHHEPGPPFKQLHVQFHSASYQVIKPSVRRRQGLLNFEISEFLNLLEMTEVFRALLRPEEQVQLFELLSLGDPKEEQFYWGRFLGQLNQEAKDMLSAWRIRQWPENRVKLLSELIDYAVLPDTR